MRLPLFRKKKPFCWVKQHKVMWRLLCDQNIRVDTVEFLRSLNHDAISARDLNLSRASDSAILAEAIKQERIVLTFNSDFGDIRYFPPETHCGVIRLRIYPQDTFSINNILKHVLTVLSPDMIRGKIAVVDRRRIRLRGKVQ